MSGLKIVEMRNDPSLAWIVPHTCTTYVNSTTSCLQSTFLIFYHIHCIFDVTFKDFILTSCKILLICKNCNHHIHTVLGNKRYMYMDLSILLAGSIRYMKTNENLTQMLRNTNFETKAQSDPEAITDIDHYEIKCSPICCASPRVLNINQFCSTVNCFQVTNQFWHKSIKGPKIDLEYYKVKGLICVLLVSESQILSHFAIQSGFLLFVFLTCRTNLRQVCQMTPTWPWTHVVERYTIHVTLFSASPKFLSLSLGWPALFKIQIILYLCTDYFLFCTDYHKYEQNDLEHYKINGIPEMTS